MTVDPHVDRVPRETERYACGTEVIATGEAPVVDVTQTNTAQNFDDTYLRKLTIGSGGRNYLAIAQQAPGVVGTGNSIIMGGKCPEKLFHARRDQQHRPHHAHVRDERELRLHSGSRRPDFVLPGRVRAGDRRCPASIRSTGSVFNFLDEEQPVTRSATTKPPPAAPPSSLRSPMTYQRPRNYQVGFRVEF